MSDGNSKRYLLDVLLAVIELSRCIVLTLSGRGSVSTADASSLLRTCLILAGEPERIKREYLDAVVRTMEKFKFVTNDIVELRWDLRGRGRELKINSLPEIGLEQLEFLVVLVVAERAQSPGLLNGKVTAPGATFLTVEEILDDIDRLRNSERLPNTRWPEFGEEDVRKAICSVRAKIAEAKGNKHLFETGDLYGQGYRLSTPPGNVTISANRGDGPGPLPSQATDD